MRQHSTYFVGKKKFFRHPFYCGKDGMLDISSDLTKENILMAYRWGIFPWVNNAGFFIWYFISPRLVLNPGDLHVQKSMRPYLNQEKFTITFDEEFEKVMRMCKNTHRVSDDGSWIDEDFIKAYSLLHECGYAHSVEVWEGEAMVGGLYGLSIGKIFYGESMFTRKNNASKYGFIKLVQYLDANDYVLIDCQQDTPHMRSLGADTITGEAFLSALRQNMLRPDDAQLWR